MKIQVESGLRSQFMAAQMEIEDGTDGSGLTGTVRVLRTRITGTGGSFRVLLISIPTAPMILTQ